MADKNSQAAGPSKTPLTAPEVKGSSSQQASESPLAKAMSEISKSDGDSSKQDTFCEKEAKEYLEANNALFLKLPKDRQDAFVKEVVEILKKYNKDITQIQVLCSIALEKARCDISKQEPSEENPDSKEIATILERSGMNPRGLRDIKKLANHFTYLFQHKESNGKKLEAWLQKNPDVITQIRNDWKERSNSVRYFLEAKGNSKDVITYIDTLASGKNAPQAVAGISEYELRKFAPTKVSVNPWKQIHAGETFDANTILELRKLSQIGEVHNEEKTCRAETPYELCMRDPDFLTDFIYVWSRRGAVYEQLKTSDPELFKFYDRMFKETLETHYITEASLWDKWKIATVRNLLHKRVEENLLQGREVENSKKINEEYEYEMGAVFEDAYNLALNTKSDTSGWGVQRILSKLSTIREKYAPEEERIRYDSYTVEGKKAYRNFRNIRGSEALIQEVLYINNENDKKDVPAKLAAMKQAFDKTVHGGIGTVVGYDEKGRSFTVTLEEMRKKMQEIVIANKNNPDKKSVLDGNSTAFANYLNAMYSVSGGDITPKKLSDELGNEVYTYIINDASSLSLKDSKALQQLKEFNSKAYNSYLTALEAGRKELRDLEVAVNSALLPTRHALYDLLDQKDSHYIRDIQKIDEILASKKTPADMAIALFDSLSGHENVTREKIKSIFDTKLVSSTQKATDVVDKQLEYIEGKKWSNTDSFKSLFKAVNEALRRVDTGKQGAKEVIERDALFLEQIASKGIADIMDLKEIDTYMELLRKYNIQDEKIGDKEIITLIKERTSNRITNIQITGKGWQKALGLFEAGKHKDASEEAKKVEEDVIKQVKREGVVLANKTVLAKQLGTSDTGELARILQKEERAGKNIDDIVFAARRTYHYENFFASSGMSEEEFSKEYARRTGLDWKDRRKDSESPKPEQAPVQSVLAQLQTAPSFESLSNESRMRIPPWDYPVGKSVNYYGYNLCNRGAQGIELEYGSTKIRFEANEEVAGMQLFHLLKWTNLLCLLPHIKDMIGQSYLSGISLSSSMKTSSGMSRKQWANIRSFALDEGEQRKILAMVGNFFLSDDETSKRGSQFDAESFSQTTGKTRERGIVGEFNEKINSATKGEGILSAIRKKGYLNLNNEIVNIDKFKADWKTKMQGFGKELAKAA